MNSYTYYLNLLVYSLAYNVIITNKNGEIVMTKAKTKSASSAKKTVVKKTVAKKAAVKKAAAKKTVAKKAVKKTRSKKKNPLLDQKKLRAGQNRKAQVTVNALKKVCTTYNKYLKTQPDIKTPSTNKHAYEALQELILILKPTNKGSLVKIAHFSNSYHKHQDTFNLTISKSHSDAPRNFLNDLHEALPSLKTNINARSQLQFNNQFQSHRFNGKLPGIHGSMLAHNLKIPNRGR